MKLQAPAFYSCLVVTAGSRWWRPRVRVLMNRPPNVDLDAPSNVRYWGAKRTWPGADRACALQAWGSPVQLGLLRLCP